MLHPPPPSSDQEAVLDALWERRMTRRRRWDRIYQRLNGAAFLVLLLTMLGYFLGLWNLVKGVLLG
jgi:hypothetical protein